MTDSARYSLVHVEAESMWLDFAGGMAHRLVPAMVGESRMDQCP